MHQVMRDRLESALSGTGDPAALAHLAECPECGREFELLLNQAMAVRTLRAPSEVEPRPGFYARVMDRIEAQGASIWDLFFESAFGKRIAIASLALALLLGIFLVTAERSEQPMVAEDEQQQEILMLPSEFAPAVTSVPGVTSVSVGGQQAPDQDSVLANLVTYQEQ
jgi:hypothetical protein